MDAATAWAEAMKFSNRPNPYPYFEDLRKTPVAKVAEHTYVVTGYPEVLALAHDPRISSDIGRSPSGLFGESDAKLDAASHQFANLVHKYIFTYTLSVKPILQHLPPQATGMSRSVLNPRF